MNWVFPLWLSFKLVEAFFYPWNVNWPSVIILATKTGSSSLLQKCIGSGFDIHSRDSTLKNALHIAATLKNPELTRILTKSGGNYHAIDRDGNTPLLIAAKMKNKEVCRILLEKGADPNQKNFSGDSPIFFLNRIGIKKKTPPYLFKKENKPDLSPMESEDFQKAVLSGNREKIIDYLGRGGNPDSLREDKRSLLLWAAGNSDYSLVQILVSRGAGVNLQDPEGRNPLGQAAYYGNIPIAVFLLDHGANIELATFPTGYRPMHYAAMRGNVEMGSLLQSRGGDLFSRDKKGRTPLDIAVENGKLDFIRFVRKRDPDKFPSPIGEKSEGKPNPPQFVILDIELRDGIKKGSLSAVRMALEKGANPDDGDGAGNSPLHLCARTNQVSIAGALLDAGAMPGVKNKWRETPLFLAIKNQNSDMVRLLLKAGDREKGVISGEIENSPLHFAIKENLTEMAALLIQAGVDVKKEDQMGDNFLHQACRRGNPSMIQLLLNSGVDSGRKNNYGETPLHLAIQSSTQGDEAIISLLQKNPPLNVSNSQGEFPTLCEQ